MTPPRRREKLHEMGYNEKRKSKREDIGE